jgi:hypothetical protein
VALNPAEQCQNNAVRVSTINHEHGSGVLFSRDGETFVWTASHLVNLSMKDNGTFESLVITRGEQYAEAEVLRSSDSEITHDIALLRIVGGDEITGDAKFYHQFNHIKLGQKVYLVATPSHISLLNVLFTGHVSAIDRTLSGPVIPNPRRVDLVDITHAVGCSGGPVFASDSGEIIGIQALSANNILSVITPTRYIYEWAKSNGCLWAFDRKIPLPDEIVPWIGHAHKTKMKYGDYSDVDNRWDVPKSTCTIRVEFFGMGIK